MSQKSRTVLFAVVAAASFWQPPTADAFPAFARKYGVACTACHESWPKLNDFGRAFRDRGYRMGTGMDEPTDKPPAYWPIAIRTTPGYSYTSQNNVETDDGLRTIGTGSFEHPEIDILTGGTLGSKASFLAVIAGFGAEATAQIESAWVRLDAIGGNPWFNLRVGKHELDQPRSSHRPLTFTQDYLIYVYRPLEDQSLLHFNMADNQLGVELSGHDDGSRTRYAVSFADANDAPGSKSVISSPLLYGHVTRRFQPFSSGALKQVRVGAFGSVGWAPTTFATIGGEPIEGSGTSNKTYTRVGGELGLWLGPMSTPLALTVVVAHASESEDFLRRDGRRQVDRRLSPGRVHAAHRPHVLWPLRLDPQRPTTPGGAAEELRRHGRRDGWNALHVLFQQPCRCRPARRVHRPAHQAGRPRRPRPHHEAVLHGHRFRVLIHKEEVVPKFKIAVACGAMALLAADGMAENGAAARGKKAYGRYCVSCHGVDGDGRGYEAQHLDPTPRNFTKGAFKWRTTPSGQIPRDEDLLRTIKNGLYGTAMPPWGALSDQDLKDLIAYVKTFSPRFAKETPDPAITIPAQPPNDASSIAAGKQTYRDGAVRPVSWRRRPGRWSLLVHLEGRVGPADQGP